jgi:large subunit ribosomal protein L25
LLHELQWDALGTKVLHVDLMRVNVNERIVVAVAIALRGEAPGTKEGGVVEQVLHEVEIETTPRGTRSPPPRRLASGDRTDRAPA